MKKDLNRTAIKMGAVVGMTLSTIYSFWTCLILAFGSAPFPTAIILFFVFYLFAIAFGILPATLMGIISAKIITMLILMESTLMAGLGKGRVIFWRIVGAGALLTFLAVVVRFRTWILENPLLSLMPVLYGVGLVWMGWQLYRRVKAAKF